MTNEINGWVGQLAGAVDQMRHWPVAVLIIAGLNVFGWCLKSLTIVPNKFIPILVISAGCALNVLLEDGSSSNRHPYVVLGLQGVLLGFAAWMLHAVLLRRLERFIPGIGKPEETPEDKKE